MPEENPPTDPSLPTNFGGIDPGELLARGMQSAKISGSGAHGWEAPETAEAARLFPGYEVLRLLGRGGMGAVYQARQIELDRLVAIKLLPLEISVDKDFADRFRREARAMAKLNHPHIITVFDFGQTSDGHLFFAMEFVEGANLHDIIHGPGLAPDQALSIAAQVCTALAYAHGKGVVHRDIKPANVMIDTDSQVKVADFGLARLTDTSATDFGHTMTGTVMGTPDYMAPEQKRGMNVDHRADIYSLGVMLYEMLCRETPQGAFELPSQRTGCDPRLDAIVLKAMQQTPDRRYQSTQEMKADMVAARTPFAMPETAVEPEVSAPPHVVAKERALVARKSRQPLWIGAAVALVSILVAISFFAKRGGTARALATAAIWKPLVLTQTQMSQGKGKETLSASGEIMPMGEWFGLPGITGRDLAIRGEVRQPASDPETGIYLRGGDHATLRYMRIFLSRVELVLHRGQASELSRRVYPPGMDIADKWVPFEFATVGRLSIATVQSLAIPPGVSEKALQSGTVGLCGFGAFRKIEIMVLDGVPEAQWPEFIRTAMKQAGITAPVGESSAATATKDAPFVNTLGMKFVPVPIIGGPSGGQRVLFSVWDTRVQDYEVFAKETKREWPKADFPQGPAHPAVNVNWEDAELFCQWLTQREQAAGRLPAEWRYRLPGDHEWSCALGLAGEDAAKQPAEKSDRIKDVFPWGAQWPPPAGAGNYAGEELRPALAAGKYPRIKDVLWGYRDDFVETAPVGSFAANRFGLFDMGGNVWQWCEDWFDKDQKDRVLRGASWHDSERGYPLSSDRFHPAPGYRDYHVGFRCVLAPASTAK